MKATRIAKEVEYYVHPGPGTIVVVGIKGEQQCKPNDIILISGVTPHDREVLKRDDFDEEYDYEGKENTKGHDTGLVVEGVEPSLSGPEHPVEGDELPHPEAPTDRPTAEFPEQGA